MRGPLASRELNSAVTAAEARTSVSDSLDALAERGRRGGLAPLVRAARRER